MGNNDIIKYGLFCLSTIATYFEPILPLLVLVLVLFSFDFVTGVWKSLKTGVKIESYKLARSFGKLLCYLLPMTLTFFTCEAMGLSDDTAIAVVKVEVWAAIYVEGLSIVENLRVIYPRNSFLGYLYYLLSVEFLKVVPRLSNYFKQEKDGSEIK
jgi:hypothetical protein